MAMQISNSYGQFYKGTELLKTYGSGGNGKNRLVRYAFNTTDGQGNKVMEQMTKEETLQAMKEISAKYGDHVIVEFSGDGMAKLIESKKGQLDEAMTQEERDAMQARDAAFQKEIVHYDKTIALPAYSGMYGADKAIATALENCSKQEQSFVYDIIRQNFLIGNRGLMTEEGRQANISLGMEKAKEAAENFIPQDDKKAFLEAMESVAKLARAGKADADGNMDYGVAKAHYLGHGKNLAYTTDAADVMRTMDGSAYAQYQKISQKEDGMVSLRYLLNWYQNVAKKNPAMAGPYMAKY